MSWAKISQLSTNISEWKKTTTICQKPFPCREIYEGWVGGAGRRRSGQLEFCNMQIGSHDLNFPIMHLTLFSLLSVRKNSSLSKRKITLFSLVI